MAALFRNNGPSRTGGAPPSAFPRSLHPVASDNLNSQLATGKRRSRLDLNFEQALQNGGTVRLKEGPDLSSLGVVSTPSPHTKYYGSPSSITSMQVLMDKPQPSTPTVVPPTPSPIAPSRTTAPSSSRPHASSAGSSSSHEQYFDAEDGDYQARRRSMFRSPGTASSPDLATLVRKTKERKGLTVETTQKEPESETALSASGSTSAQSKEELASRSRQRSQTTSSPQKQKQAIPSFPQSLSSGWQSKAKSIKNGNFGPEKVGSPVKSTTESRSRSDTVMSKGKSSVRAKTSALIGKLMGQGSIRDKSPHGVDSYSRSKSYVHGVGVRQPGAHPPPVPQIPKEHRPSPSFPPLSDVFSDTSHNKALPSIDMSSSRETDVADSDDEQSLVMVDSVSSQMLSEARSPSPDKTLKGRSQIPIKGGMHVRRRSMSLGDVDLSNTLSSQRTSLATEESKDKPCEWDNIMKDFRGELSQLDQPSGSSLLLKDVFSSDEGTSLQARTPQHARTVDAIHPTSRSRLPQRPQLLMTASSPNRSQTPTLTFDTTLNQSNEPSKGLPAEQNTPPGVSRTSVEEPIIPPRKSSLQLSRQTSSIAPRLSPMRIGGHRQGSLASPLSAGVMSPMTRDATRLQVQHRSSASASEPSLIPVRDGDPNRTVRLVPSATSMRWPDATSPTLSLYLNSQTDLISEDMVVTKKSPSPATDSGELLDSELETRGKELAGKCWAEDEDFVQREKIAEWLGSIGRINKIALRYYIEYFDFSGLRLDMAFRRLCSKLYLKAETQQVDRILEQFSHRYWEHNPRSVYGSASVVHAVTYSLLLLNTDLHVANLVQRMSRNQFVRNTLAAIQMQLHPSEPTRASTPELTYDDCSSVRGVGSDGSETGSTLRTRDKRSNSITSWNSISRDLLNTPTSTSAAGSSSAQLDSTPAQLSAGMVNAESRVKTPSLNSVVYDRNFDSDMESLLKEMYSAIKAQQILQPLCYLMAAERRSTSSLSPSGHLLRKTSQRGQNDRVMNLKRGSMRGIQTLFAQNGASPYSSNSSIDGRISPAPSFAISAHDAYNASTSSFLSPTMGFASNLSHTIIREAQEDDHHSCGSCESDGSDISITDEELALLGAPWAKEGNLCRKQYWESSGKRAKSKSWLDVFVVIQKGELSMFTFGESGMGGTQHVGGGNWLTNAHAMGTVQLSHSLAHALPPPGYNRQRPHCFVLTLASGGVYFFQAGTQELVSEWVSTCNYWAARQSKEPLAGGVSNMEFGWNRIMDEETNNGADTQITYSRDDVTYNDSDTLSVRSGRSKLSKKDGPFTLRSTVSPYADRMFIHEWKAPISSGISSMHDEESQLDALQKHVDSLKLDFKQHTDLKLPMMRLYSSRSANSVKALGNWERKSQYLLTEIVKYDSYIECLKSAMSLRLKKRGEKALEKALDSTNETASNADPVGTSQAAKSRWKGRPEEATILEGDEPPSTPLP